MQGGWKTYRGSGSGVAEYGVDVDVVGCWI